MIINQGIRAEGELVLSLNSTPGDTEASARRMTDDRGSELKTSYEHRRLKLIPHRYRSRNPRYDTRGDRFVLRPGRRSRAARASESLQTPASLLGSSVCFWKFPPIRVD